LQLLQVPNLKSFLNNLASANEKEDFQKHIRKYVNFYLLDYPFEVSRTTRYSPMPEAALKARKNIKRGEIIYLCGT
jgi:histone-lysine N-methyltransferase SUV420H